LPAEGVKAREAEATGERARATLPLKLLLSRRLPLHAASAVAVVVWSLPRPPPSRPRLAP
jgi:hypothetical protein